MCCRIVLADVAMICTGLFGALSINNYRWGYFAISCLFFLVVLWGLFDTVAKVRRTALAAFNALLCLQSIELCLVLCLVAFMSGNTLLGSAAEKW